MSGGRRESLRLDRAHNFPVGTARKRGHGRDGRVKTRRVLSFFGIDIPLYLGSLDGEYVASKNVKRFESNGMYIPVMLTETTFCEVEKKTVTVDTETARQMALEMLAAEEGEQLKNAEILSREVSFTETDGGCHRRGKILMHRKYSKC